MFVATVMLLLFSLQSFAVGNAGVTYHGRLMRPDGAPVTGTAVQFKLQIRSPGSENCLMYEETRNVNLSNTAGVFAITMNDGGGSRTDTTGYSLDQVFANKQGSIFTLTGQCNVGNTYSPNVADGRQIAVSFNDGSGWEPIAPQTINFVPSAIEAMQISGYRPNNLLRIDGGTITAFSPAQGTELLNLVNGASTQYSKPSDLAALSLTGDASGSLSAVSVDKLKGRPLSPAVPSTGQVLKWNGVTWGPAADDSGAGTLTAVTASMPLVSSGGASPNITLANGTVTGQTLRWNGSAWTANSLNYTDLKNNVAASPWPTVSCSGSEYISWSSVSDSFVCASFPDATAVVKGVVQVGAGLSVSAGVVSLPDVVSTGTFSKVTVDAKGRVVSGANISAGDITSTLGYTPLSPANNLSDVSSAATARTNLGLGTSATLNVAAAGNAGAGEVVKGNDTRLTDARIPTGAAGGDLSGTFPNPVLASTGVAAGTYTKVTVDAKGRVLGATSIGSAEVLAALGYTPVDKAGDTMSGALVMGGNNINNVGHIEMAAQKTLLLGSYDNSQETTLVGSLVVGDRGKAWFNTSTGQIKYWNGSAAVTVGTSGAGLTNLNGLTGATQTLAVGSTGTTAAWTSVGSSHTINIPNAASTGVTRGLLSKADYDTFMAKQDALGFTPLNPANNLSDLTTPSAARSNLGLGTAATKAFGTSAGNLVELDAGGKILASVLPSSVIQSGATAGGDLTGTYPNPTLNTTGVGAGTYKSVTVDVKGRVTAGTNPTTLSGYGITDSVQNMGGTQSIQSGLDASKGAGSTAGRIWVATDTKRVYRDNGSTWDLVGTSNAADLTGTLATAQLPTVPVTKGGTGLTALGSSNQVLGVDAAGTGAEYKTITAGSGVNVTHGANSITITATGSGGTVTNIATGTGLTGGPITGTGTISIAAGGVSAPELASNAVTTVKILDAAVTTPKLFSNPGINRLVGTDASTGAGLAPITCGSADQILKWTVATGWQCDSVANIIPVAASGFIKDGGNSTGAGIAIGTNDTQAFSLKSNNAARFTMASSGFIGMGPASTNPQYQVHIRTASTGAESIGLHLQNDSNVDGTASSLSFGSTATQNLTTAKISNYRVSSTDRGLAFSTYNGSSLNEQMRIQGNGNVGIGTTSPSVSLDLSGRADALRLPVGNTAAQPTPANGMMRYNSQTNKFEAYENGGWVNIIGGGSITSFNGLNAAVQTFSTPGSSGTAPGWSSAGSAHTLNIPLASASGVTAGLISKTEYDNFNNKLSGIPNVASLASTKIWVGDGAGKAQEVSLSSDGTLSNTGALTVTRIQSHPVVASAPTTGQFLVSNGTQYSPVSMSVDATMTSAGAVTIASNAITTGKINNNAVTTAKINDAAITTPKLFSNPGVNQLVATDASTGATLAPVTCGSPNQVLKWTAGTGWQCDTVSNLVSATAGGFIKDGGNTTGADIAIGTNDNRDVNIKSNNLTRLTVASTGNVGIGTVAPGSPLDVSGVIRTDAICDRNGANCHTINAGWSTGAATSVVAGWPDAIKCSLNASSEYAVLFYNSNWGGKISYYAPDAGAYVKFASNGTYDSNALLYNGTALNCVNKSVSQLQSSGQTYYLAGGGGGIWTQSGSDTYFTGGQVGIGVVTPSVSLDISGRTDAIRLPVGNTAAQPASPANGMMRYNSQTNKFEAYENGGWTNMISSGSGITSFGGQSGASQTLGTPGTTGTAPNWVSATNTHTLHIPMASAASVTAGLISKTEYDNFNTKLSTIPNVASLASTKIWVGDGAGKAQEVSLSSDGTLSNTGALTVTKIQNHPVASGAPTTGQFLVSNGTQYSAVSMSSDATMTSAGAITIASNAITTSKINANAVTTPKLFSNPGVNRIVATDSSTGATLAPLVCGSADQVLKWTVATGWQCDTVSNLVSATAGGFIKDGGNSTGANISIGTNDNRDFSLKSNNVTRMTVASTGNIGIGTTPTMAFDVLTPGYISARFKSSNSSDPTMILKLEGATGGGRAGLFLENPGSAGSMIVQNSSNLEFFPTSNFNGTPAMVITNTNSNVGVGSTGPDMPFLVQRDGPSIGATFYSVSGFVDSSYHKGVLLGYSSAGNNVAFVGADTYTGPSSLAFTVANSGGSTTERMRIDGASGNVGIGTATPSVALDIGSRTDAIRLPSGNTAAQPSTPANGMMRYNSQTNKFEGYENGGWSNFIGGGSMTSLNGLSVAVQTFSTPGTSGTAPNWVSSGSGHALNIPLASAASVTAGLISKTEYDNFNSKLGVIPNVASLASAKIWVGDGAGKAQEVSMSTDATLSNTGSLTIANNAITTVKINNNAVTTAKINDGAVTTPKVFSNPGINQLVSTDGSTGGTLSALACGSANQVLKWTVATGWQCDAVANIIPVAASGFIKDGGNSAGATISVGTSDNQDFVLKSNNLTRLTVASAGNVGIGTTSPAVTLDMSGRSDAIRLPAGNTAAQPTGANGMMRYNSQTNKFEAYENGGWANMISGGGGGDFMKDGTVSMTGVFKAVDGAYASPGVQFASDATIGLYKMSTGDMAIRGGTSIFRVNSTGAGFQGNTSAALLTTGTTAGSPAYTFAGDANTGMFSAATDNIGFSTNGTERMHIDSAGKIGINVASPSNPLHLKWTGGYPQIYTDGRDNSNGLAGMRFLANDASNNPTYGDVAVDPFSKNLVFSAAVTTASLPPTYNPSMVLTTTGRVGIGKTNPSYPLDVAGDIQGYSGYFGGLNVTNTTGIGFETISGTAGDAYSYSGMAFANTVNTKKWMYLYRNGTTVGADINKFSMTYYDGSTYTDLVTYSPTLSVGINNTSPSASALLDLTSTTKGLLPPRMTTGQRDAISTPSTGLTIYNLSTNALNVYNGSSWGAPATSTNSMTQETSAFDVFADFLSMYDASATADRKISPSLAMIGGRNFFRLEDEAIGGGCGSEAGLGCWTSGTGSGEGSSPLSDANHIGVHQFNTGTTATGYAAYASSNPYAFYLGGGRMTMVFIFKTDVLSTAAQRYQYGVGLHNNTFTLTPNSAVLVRYKDDVNSGKFELVTRNGGVETATDTGVTVAANTWYRVEFDIAADGSSVKASVNGSSQVTNTTNIPVSTGLQLSAQILKTVGTTSRSIFVDYIGVLQAFTTPR